MRATPRPESYRALSGLSAYPLYTLALEHAVMNANACFGSAGPDGRCMACRQLLCPSCQKSHSNGAPCLFCQAIGTQSVREDVLAASGQSRLTLSRESGQRPDAVLQALNSEANREQNVWQRLQNQAAQMVRKNRQDRMSGFPINVPRPEDFR